MKKSMILFAAVTILAAGMAVYGWTFVDSQIGQVVLQEETITGDKAAAEGLTAGFRADSSDKLHWTSSFDYSTGRTESSFKRGEMETKADFSVYDEIRFNGWSAAPYVTYLNYEGLGGLQQKKIHAFYDKAQKEVSESGAAQTGKIKVKDYLDFYPVSFQFRFGSKLYNSQNTLTGLKVYEEAGSAAEGGWAYDEDLTMYSVFNSLFKIPVIENEYQEYRVTKVKDYDPKKELACRTEVKKPLGQGEDYYEFDPVIVLQEENIKDGKKWEHPDLSGGLSYETEGEQDNAYIGKLASEYNLKNRMLFTVNNRTAKGAPVDMSQLKGGYGVYELPFQVKATATIKHGPKSRTVTNPVPVLDQLKMVYPLDEKAEYVEMSLSGDHRYLAVFSVRDGAYFVEMIDADRWTSPGPFELFSASEKMTYTWGEDGSLAATNHRGDIAVLARTEREKKPYEILYSGQVSGDMDKILFSGAMTEKEHSTARYQYGVDSGLAVTVKDGKAALVQSLPAGADRFDIRNAGLVCAVIDKSGIIYSGRVKSNITDLGYDMSEEELQAVRKLLDRGTKEEDVSGSLLIQPVRNETWAAWKTAD